MKITEDKKAIINLIEPFMNKNLELGTLLLHNEKIYHFIAYKDDTFKTYICMNEDFGIEEIEENSICKILWNYEMTAVIKFFISKGYSSSHYSPKVIEFCNKDEENFTTEFSIPGIPLNVYKMDQDLWLLQELKNKKLFSFLNDCDLIMKNPS